MTETVKMGLFLLIGGIAFVVLIGAAAVWYYRHKD